MRRDLRGTALLVIAAFVALSVIVGLVVYVWRQLAEVEMGVHGWLALLLGVGLTLAVGIGLMSLVYYSHKRGYDNDAGHF